MQKYAITIKYAVLCTKNNHYYLQTIRIHKDYCQHFQKCEKEKICNYLHKIPCFNYYVVMYNLKPVGLYNFRIIFIFHSGFI